MGRLFGAAKENVGIVAGGLLGFFAAGIAVNAVQSGLTPILGSKNAKFAQAAAGGAVSLGAFYFASRMKKPDMLVAFGAVALGYAIQGVLGAINTQAS